MSKINERRGGDSYIKATDKKLSYATEKEVDELSLYTVDVLLDRYFGGDIRKGETIYSNISNPADEEKLQQTLSIYDTQIESKSESIEQLIEKQLQEVSSEIYQYLSERYPGTARLASIAGKELEWDVYGARSLCLRILEEVNDHVMMSKVEKLFEANW